MAKTKTKFICQNCGYETYKWLGKCPSCNEWNSFAEEIYEKRKGIKKDLRDISVENLIDVKIDQEDRIKTSIE
ncbi:DNA repair protein RadA, partial [Anaerosalibacter bizertensis]|nr:DNA repair protein RadA [Anaerosalibacter bizertensis]